MRPTNQVEVIGNRATVAEPGQLASAIIMSEAPLPPDTEIRAVDLPENATVVVYCRKTDGTLRQAIRYCNEKGVPLVFLSSKIEIPEDEDLSNFSRIDGPNAATTVVDYVLLLHEVARVKYPGWIATITEFHQESKKDTSGTALSIAKQRADPTRIISVRWDDMAINDYGYDIPEKIRNGYANNSTTFTNPETGEVSEPYDIVIAGREPYVEGLMSILEGINNHPEAFEKGQSYHLTDLVKSGIVRTRTHATESTPSLAIEFSSPEESVLGTRALGSTALVFTPSPYATEVINDELDTDASSFKETDETTHTDESKPVKKRASRNDRRRTRKNALKAEREIPTD